MNANQMLKKHGEKLFNALDMAVNSLDDLETLVPILIQLGYSHYTWGVRDKHFVVNKRMLIQLFGFNSANFFSSLNKIVYW